MQRCVIYARVSTKEQQDEGYSIPAQLKAIREFCVRQKLQPVAEFVEAESAASAGREEFARMLAHLATDPEGRVVVVHKLDRLARNYEDLVSLDKLAVKVRCVNGDIPDSVQGVLFRDIMMVFARNYSLNLSQEIRKGMNEKVAQGGWPHRAPFGYLNDKGTRSLLPDPLRAPLIRYAFERYSGGVVSVRDLADELHAKGLRTVAGRKVSASLLHEMLRHPIYAGRIPYRGEVFPGAHEAIVPPALFEEVQERLSGNRNGNKAKKHTYALRGVMYCAECGCKITAGTHKGHVYYRCTHGKGKDSCSQRAYSREDVLTAKVEALLSRIELGPEVVAALAKDAALLAEQQGGQTNQQRVVLERAIAANKDKDARLLDAYLEGTVPVESYRAKAQSLQDERRTLELRLSELDSTVPSTAALVEARAYTAATARIRFAQGDEDVRREVLSAVLCNLSLQDGEIASYQWKRPFEVLEKDPKGAFIHQWWPETDLNRRHGDFQSPALPTELPGRVQTYGTHAPWKGQPWRGAPATTPCPRRT